MKTRRTRITNIAIQTCFERFYEDLKRYKNKTCRTSLWIEEVENSSERLRCELFGMHLVGAMSWRDYLTLREKVYRIKEETKRFMKNNI